MNTVTPTVGNCHNIYMMSSSYSPILQTSALQFRRRKWIYCCKLLPLILLVWPNLLPAATLNLHYFEILQTHYLMKQHNWLQLFIPHEAPPLAAWRLRRLKNLKKFHYRVLYVIQRGNFADDFLVVGLVPWARAGNELHQLFRPPVQVGCHHPYLPVHRLLRLTAHQLLNNMTK